MRCIKLFLIVMASTGIIFSSSSIGHADQTSELLLKLLVKKGVITQKEADELRTEVAAIQEKEELPSEEKVAKHVKKASWADRIKVKGDVRLRHEYKSEGAGSYVNRPRIRARVGIDADITDSVKAGLTVATRGNARSTNEDLNDVFDPIDFDLDMAWIQWTPNKRMRFIGGKYDIPIYHPGDLLWDSDLRFEGVSAHFNYPLNDLGIPMNTMLTTGIFILDNISPDRKNPYLYTVQGGVGSSFGEHLDWKTYVGYLDFVHIKGNTGTSTSLDLIPVTARATPAGYYYYDYNILELSGDVTFHFLEKYAPKPFDVPLILFGDYITNLADGKKRNGFELGFKLGKKVKKFGDWRYVYNFRSLERNSFPEQFPDADSFQGNSNGYGHESIFSFGLWKNVWLEVDYYISRDKHTNREPDEWVQIIQSDINVKF